MFYKFPAVSTSHFLALNISREIKDPEQALNSAAAVIAETSVRVLLRFCQGPKCSTLFGKDNDLVLVQFCLNAIFI